jgi:chromosomal replication initiation ATPase DnaA
MLSSVLNSPRAIQVNLEIIRIFTQLRRIVGSAQPDLTPQLEAMESRLQQKLDRIEARFETPAPTTFSPPQQDRVSIVLKNVARHFGLTSADLKSESRAQPLALARHIAIFFMKKHLGMGLSEIGRHLGGRDHSTILHAYRKIHVDSEDNDAVRNAIVTLRNEMQPLMA